MKIVAISDTHGLHKQLQLPKGDLLLHAGDVSARGHKKQIRQFLKWFAEQDFEHKVFIAGNHDFYFEQASKKEVLELIPEGVTYLNDSGVTINGVHIWGSPVQPWFHDWAFNRQRGSDIEQHWELIPTSTDILLTHGPPLRYSGSHHPRRKCGLRTITGKNSGGPTKIQYLRSHSRSLMASIKRTALLISMPVQ